MMAFERDDEPLEVFVPSKERPATERPKTTVQEDFEDEND